MHTISSISTTSAQQFTAILCQFAAGELSLTDAQFAGLDDESEKWFTFDEYEALCMELGLA